MVTVGPDTKSDGSGPFSELDHGSSSRGGYITMCVCSNKIKIDILSDLELFKPSLKASNTTAYTFT